ncbi:hypothetical protein BASA60_000612 [Batrachochytrium salamandrivorans]|nr:hypothetical protein BASA60_000612 [Batrachochytrium salamandrivorans]
MLSLYGLFILLLTAEAIHAQGNKDDGDDANQASGSKDAPKQDTDLPLKVHPINLSGFLRKTKAPDQNGASSSADPQPKKECKGGRWLRKISKSCSQQQSPPELRPSTSYDLPQSDEMLLPVRVGKSEVKSYTQDRDIKDYRKLITSEESHGASCGEWMDVLSYVEEKEPLDIEEIRDIIKKIVDAMINLKRQGVVHGNLIGWEEGQSASLKSSDPPSPAPEYKAGDNELQTLDPGVENVYTWLRDGVLNGEADLDQRWLDGTVEHESMGTRYDNRALAARLADFLQVAYHAVSIHIMAQYHQDRLVEVG